MQKSHKHTHTHKHTRTHTSGVHFVLANYCWARDRPGSVVDMPSDTPLKKANFPSPSKYQLQIVAWLWMGLCVHFLVSVLGFCLVWTCVGLCMYQPLRVHMCINPSVFGWCCFWRVICHLWSLEAFCFLFRIACWTWREGVWPRHPI